jgi:copper homeostasis protein
MPTHSGQSKSALAGLPVLRELLRRSQRTGGPAILPGAGINHGTISHVMDHLLPHGLKEVHLSGGRWVDGGMVHRPEGMGMGASGEGQWGVWQTDGNAIRDVRRTVDGSANSVDLIR